MARIGMPLCHCGCVTDHLVCHAVTNHLLSAPDLHVKLNNHGCERIVAGDIPFLCHAACFVLMGAADPLEGSRETLAPGVHCQ